MKNTIKMSINLRKELHKKTKDEAEERGLTLNALVITILEERYKGK